MTNRLTSGARNSASMIGNMRANHGKEVATGRAGDRHSSAGACIGPDRQLASRKARRAWSTYHTKKRAIVATEKGAGSGTSNGRKFFEGRGSPASCPRPPEDRVSGPSDRASGDWKQG